MFFTKYRNLVRWLMVLASFIIISLILWNTYVFFQHFKSEERSKMNTWTFAYVEFLKDIHEQDANDPNFKINVVADYIVIDSTLTTPMLLVDNEKNIISYRNINGYDLLKDSQQEKIDSVYVYENKDKIIQKFISENTPVYVDYIDQTLYYGNSPLINKLKYYPLALLLIIFLFGAVVYFFYRSTQTAAQNKLWSGMAKETAHQIGTPLSSLVGWTEILKSENVNPEYLKEIEKDISRLETITERFSKIGSLPTFEKADIVEETVESFDYLKARSSKLVDFEIKVPEEQVLVNLNRQLYSWTIENLVKNGIDAMKGKGKLSIEIIPMSSDVKILVSDTGKGISKKQFHAIFEPGYTTKKRGWGLGLSLAKRIIEEFHKGKIKVLQSEVDKGTTIQISLKTITS